MRQNYLRRFMFSFLFLFVFGAFAYGQVFNSNYDKEEYQKSQIQNSNVDWSNPVYQIKENLDPIVPPYVMGFEEDEDFASWTIVDANEDNKTWEIQAMGGYNSDGCVRYHYSYNVGADDWLISPKLSLEAGKNYGIMLKARKNSTNYTERFKIFIGNGPSPDQLTTEIFNVEESEMEVTVDYQEFSAVVTINTTGDYYVGIQATSPPNQYYLYVDDFMVFESTGDDLGAVLLDGPSRTVVGTENRT